MTSIALTSDEDWRALASYLPGNYEQLAKQHKQLQVQYGNAKLTTADWLLRFILLHVGGNLPLRQTVALMAEAGGPKLSAMRLHMKMRRATPYLQALVERMVTWTSDAQPELWDGYSMSLIDATAVCGPGATTVDARIHTKMRVADVAILDAVVTDVKGGETLKHFQFAPNELVIADRAYSNHKSIAHVREDGADVLVRFNRGAMPVRADGVALDVLARVRKLDDDEVLDLDVVAEHNDEVRGRLVAVRLPPAQAERARKRLRKELGASHVTKESLEGAGYVIIFTTVPRSRMRAVRCLDAYRLRWQIELQFKRWKSLCGFDRLPNYRDDTIIAWVHAKVLLGILLDRMSSIRGELSPPLQLASYERPKRRPRRSRAASDGATAVEADEPVVSDRPRRAPTAVAS